MACGMAEFPADDLAIVRSCNTSSRFNIPLKRDDGSKLSVTCFRAQHSNLLAPTAGGLRFDANASLEKTEALASIIALQLKAHGLPKEGAMGSIKINPKDFSPEELERISRLYSSALAESNLGGASFVDLGTNQKVMEWVGVPVEENSNLDEIAGKGLYFGTKNLLSN